MNGKRLPRDKRVTQEARPTMVLTARDCQVMKAVNDFRALKATHIQALFFPSLATAQYRLVRLFQHGYLNRQYVDVPTGSSVNTPPLYTLAPRGAQTLTDVYSYEHQDIHVPKKAFAWNYVAHLLAVNDIRIAVMLAAAAQAWSIEQWEAEHVFRAAPDYVTITAPNGRKGEKPVLPDGYFRLATPQGRAHFFLEVDRGREAESAFRPQIEVYEAYTASGQYQARYSQKSLRILVVTTSANRLNNLMKVTAKAGGDAKYWFTTFSQVSQVTVLTIPIWQRIGSATHFPLVPLTKLVIT